MGKDINHWQPKLNYHTLIYNVILLIHVLSLNDLLVLYSPIIWRKKFKSFLLKLAKSVFLNVCCVYAGYMFRKISLWLQLWIVYYCTFISNSLSLNNWNIKNKYLNFRHIIFYIKTNNISRNLGHSSQQSGVAKSTKTLVTSFWLYSNHFTLMFIDQ